MTDAALIGAVDAPNLHVMSYNIRRRLPHLNPLSPDRWERRRGLLKRQLAVEQPAVLGVQEALPDQALFVLAALGTRYRFVGRGRESDGSGEGCPLFYDADRVRLLDWNQQALSDTPDVPGSATWGNRVPRVIVSATFRDLSTTRELVVINTHLDHQFHASRARSASAIRQLMLRSKRPVIAMGDFNTDAGTAPHAALIADGKVVDTWMVGDRRSESWGTFPNYRQPQHGRKRIDWIVATPAIEVLAAAINVSTFDGAWPSDHTPVHAIVRVRAP